MERPGTTDAAIAEHEQDLAQLEVSFERAVKALHMHFQPIVLAGLQASEWKVFAYEALLRSKEPALPHPGAVLEAAERLNRLPKLGRIIRRHVAKSYAADTPDALLFVNLHALDLLDPSLSSPYSPLAKVAKTVVLEITERASLDSVSDPRYRIAELRELGYRIAIDDFGAGHSRMASFTLVDTDFVKLDMSLIRGIDSHPVKQDLAKNIITLCREHGIKVIAEGVETMAEAEALMELEADFFQGYLICRPGPPFPVIE